MCRLGYRCKCCKQTLSVEKFKFRKANGYITLYICANCHSNGGDLTCIAVCPCITVPETMCSCKVDIESEEWKKMAYAVAARNEKGKGNASGSGSSSGNGNDGNGEDQSEDSRRQVAGQLYHYQQLLLSSYSRQR